MDFERQSEQHKFKKDKRRSFQLNLKMKKNPIILTKLG